MAARGTRGGVVGRGRYRWLGLGALALALGGGPGCSKEAAFRDAMYPKDPELPPAPSYDLTASAALTPLVASGFDAPAAAATCLHEMLAVPELAVHMDLSPAFRARIAALMGYADCVDPLDDPYNANESPARRRRRCAASYLGDLLVPPSTPDPEPGGVTDGVAPGTGPFEIRCGDAADLSRPDRLRLVRVVTDLAETIAANERASSGQTRDPLPCWATTAGACANNEERRNYERGVQRAVALGIALLRHDPAASRAPGSPPVTSFPTLALSGGAANGAFTAGYFNALLSYRLAALKAKAEQREREQGAARGAERRAELDARYRIGTVAGTSVGSLVGLLLDLYFAPETGDEPAEPRLPEDLFPGCNANDPTNPNWHEDCALGALRAIFNKTEEGDLLCAERGSAVGLLSPPRWLSWLWRPNDHLLRFDPLVDDLLRPFVAKFHRVMLDNDLVRLTVGADLTQNMALGLDERACRLPGVNPEACILLALQTSIAEPVFVPPVRRVYSGVYLQRGEGSPRDATARLTWFDGGLRSGTPAVLALLRAGGAKNREDESFARVLAVTTTPFEGIAKVHPKDGLTTFFDSTFDAVDQVRKWEIAHAQLLAEARQTSLWTFDGRPLVRRRPPASWCPPEPTTDATPPASPESGASSAAGAWIDPEATEGGSPRPPTARARGVAPSIVSASVLPIFVPSTIEPRALFAAGYQFDPKMMEGLYLWGELTFLLSYERILHFLGWKELIVWEGVEQWVAKQRWEAEGQLCRELGAGDGCDREEDLASNEQLADHYAERRKAARKSIKKCPRD